MANSYRNIAHLLVHLPLDGYSSVMKGFHKLTFRNVIPGMNAYVDVSPFEGHSAVRLQLIKGDDVENANYVQIDLTKSVAEAILRHHKPELFSDDPLALEPVDDAELASA